MQPFTVNGEVWRVVLADPGDPRLIDREGRRTVGTTDPLTRTVHISSALRPPELDRVVLHEAAHAATISHGLLDGLHRAIADGDKVGAEEWAAQLVELHGIEAAEAASKSLGRPVCVRGFCHD